MLALLFDIHGNLPALDAVLDDAHAAGARRYVLGGDDAVFGGWPAEAVARLRELEGAARVREVADSAPWGEIIAGRIERAGLQ